MAKKKHQGHYCKVCGEYKSNESFTGKGHKNHICKKCAKLSKEDREKMMNGEFEEDSDLFEDIELPFKEQVAFTVRNDKDLRRVVQSMVVPTVNKQLRRENKKKEEGQPFHEHTGLGLLCNNTSFLTPRAINPNSVTMAYIV